MLPLALIFYTFFAAIPSQRIYLLFANMVACIALLCWSFFIADNVVPSGVSSFLVDQASEMSLTAARWTYTIAVIELACQLHFLIRYRNAGTTTARWIPAFYILSIPFILMIWSPQFLIASSTPVCEYSSWMCAVPWWPSPGPFLYILITVFCIGQIWSMKLLWKTSEHDNTPDRWINYKVARNSFLILIGTGLADMSASGMGYAGINSLPLAAIVAAIAIAIDLIQEIVEEIRQKQRLLKEREDERKHTQWLESMATFLKHEANNALVGANTSLTLLQRRVQLPVDDKYLTRAQQSLRVLSTVVDSVNQATSIESTFLKEKTYPLALCSLIKEQIDGYSAIHSDVNFKFSYDAERIFVMAQEERIIQLVDKLINNAIDHRKAGTPICIICHHNEKHAVIKVINEGIPLPPDKEIIFDLFKSFRESNKKSNSSGLGLYVVKMIAEGYGGSVMANDPADYEGAEFTVTLPIAKYGAKHIT